MHSDLAVTRNRRARLWIDDVPRDADAVGDKVLQATLLVAPHAATRARVAVEVSLNTEPRLQYGLIGADFVPRDGTSDLHVSVPYSETAGPLFTTPLVFTRERVNAGLPPEYAIPVFDTFRAMTENQLCRLSGELTICSAAHSEAGSSPALFIRLTHLLVALLQDPSPDKEQALRRLVGGDLFDMRRPVA